MKPVTVRIRKVVYQQSIRYAIETMRGKVLSRCTSIHAALMFVPPGCTIAALELGDDQPLHLQDSKS